MMRYALAGACVLSLFLLVGFSRTYFVERERTIAGWTAECSRLNGAMVTTNKGYACVALARRP